MIGCAWLNYAMVFYENWDVYVFFFTCCAYNYVLVYYMSNFVLCACVHMYVCVLMCMYLYNVV